ncbi:MAG: hypothetical protein KatS3mg024_2723 [Armatimonadota bacterium]|nr:MAG: hypothetical protein KatS3mg024_2723 [Armatimonadota bacterium]
MKSILALTIGAFLVLSASGVSRAGQEDFFWVKDWSPRKIVIVCACGAVHTEPSASRASDDSTDTRAVAAAPNY